ncbi:short-chain dehydrogenase/reductase [Rhodococcus sp. 06-235-1A]|uniref:SDR family oxidoreductase n=1 Tax=Rhodococcus sp. 06-235-1A TaxID=2022508 RepID=UPI000B9B6231|nr:SDR family oxidoreductase [Rhodococcus sp. 06-235-1A]OZC95429.1 short-chain dehydrogenase/reductase [Rhodococcus sp. 06-235-1A]
MNFPSDRPATWFVTGTSRGLGLEMVVQLLERGDNVAATTRSAQRLTDALASHSVDTANLLVLEVDLRDQHAVDAAVAQTSERFSSLDVVVNNAGYGFLAAVEETSERAVRDMLDVQVVGVWNVLRATLPRLRAGGGGHIVNVSSVLGLVSIPGWGLYCAGKYALEGLSESLAGEVAGHGITVTIVEPGYFRTDFLSASLTLPEQTTDAYPTIRDMVATHLEMPGSQLGDPAKGAREIISNVVEGGTELRQILGSDSHAYATGKVASLTATLVATQDSAPRTDFAQA